MYPPVKASSWCLLLTLGCSTTSTITRTYQGPIEGDIVGGSPDSIFVATDSGREYEISRDDISSIDYPGNVHANVGAGVVVYGGINIALGMPKCNERKDDKAAFCTGVFTPAVIGLGMIVWGVVVHYGQTSAVADTSRSSKLKPPSPPGPRKMGPFVTEGGREAISPPPPPN
jgi:hypothetical protein